MIEKPRFGVFEEEKNVAYDILRSDALDFISWNDIRTLSIQHPDIRKRILDVNPIWLLGQREARRDTSPFTPSLSKLVSFALIKSFVPNDAISIKDGSQLRERRHYVGIDSVTPFVSDGFVVSTADTPPEAMQPQHHHLTRNEIIIPLEPIWLTTKREQTTEGESALIRPKEFAWIGVNTYHTLVNPSKSYSPHLCLRFPETVPWMDWNSDPPEDPALDFSYGTIGEDGVCFSQEGQSVRMRIATRFDTLGPSKFGYLIFARATAMPRGEGVDRDDFGSFLFVPPSRKQTPLLNEPLEGFEDDLILFQRIT